MRSFFALLQRDLLLAWRHGGGTLTNVLFFLALTLLIPLGTGPDLALLGRIAPAVLWIGALLATFLALERLFQADEEDGSLDILFLSPLSAEALVTAKALAYWLSHGLPIVIAAPFYGLMLGLTPANLPALLLSLLIGTLALTAIGTLGAALTLNVQRSGLLLPILVLPLSLPVLIFGIIAAQNNLPLFCGISILMTALSLFGAALALRMARS